MRCPGCQHDNPSRARFCLECGQRLAQACPACGAELPDGAKFCLECGRALPAPTAKPDPGGPAVYTPRHLAERILTSRAALEGERRPVTVLFCDLVSSTPLAERLGAEGMHALLGRFFEIALAEVHRYEGTVNQFLGDGFMALFGAPLTHEDHPSRAVRAALGLGRVLSEGPVRVDARTEVSLAVRMGLHTGFVVVGAIGDNLRMDYTAIGDTTHLAARLQQRAEPGQILVSEATARLVEKDAALAPLGPLSLKGRAAPVAVFAVTGPGQRRSSVGGPGSRALSRFVGRDHELTALLDRFDQVAEGRGQAVGIVGEPGVGKSRLLHEFHQSIAARVVRYFEGRCLSYGGPIPYLPVADMIRTGCRIADADTPEVVADKARQALGEVGMEPDDALPYLLQVLGFKEGGDGLSALAPEALKTLTFRTLRQLFLRASQTCPVVIEVEDLHWIDRTSEEFLGSLVESLGGASILLAGTYRPGYHPPWMDRSFATQLALTGLASPDSLAIVRSVLPDSGLGDARARLILDRAEGNPFFLEEHRQAAEALRRLHPERVVELAPLLAHHYAEAEAWTEAAHHAGRAAGAAASAFANREALAHYDRAIRAAELAGLGAAERLTLREDRAAVHAVLGAFEPAREDLEAALAREEIRSPAVEAHVLGALGALWGGHRDYERGLDLSRQAVAAGERAGDAPSAPGALADARMRLGLMLCNLGRTVEGRRELQHALASFRQVGDLLGEARTLDSLAMASVLGAELDDAIAHAREAIPRLQAVGDRHTEASCISSLAFALICRGRRTEGESWLRQAIEAARAIGARAQEAYVLWATGELLDQYGEYGIALRDASAGLTLARELAHREWTAGALGVLGRIHRTCGDVAEARRLHEEMLGMARELRTALWFAAALGEVGEDLAVLGQDDEAARYLADALAQSGDALEFSCRPRLALAALALRRGRPDEALEHARAMQTATPQYALFAVDGRRAEGEAWLALSRRTDAEAALRAARAKATALGASPPRWRACLALAALCETTSRPAEARALRVEARELLEAVSAGLAEAPALQAGFEGSEVARRARRQS